MKFKPFDLDKFRHNNSMNVVTRDGHKVVIIDIVDELPQPIVGYVILENGPSTVKQWNLNGNYYHTIPDPADYDLFFGPELKTKYYAVDPDTECSRPLKFTDKDIAERYCNDNDLILGTLTYEI